MESSEVPALQAPGQGWSTAVPRPARSVPRVDPGSVAALPPAVPETMGSGVRPSLEFTTWWATYWLGYLGSSCAFF